MTTPAAPTPLDRRAAWWTAGLAALVLAAAGGWLVPWDWVPEGSLLPAEESALFTERELARLEGFAGVQRLLGLASYGVSLVVALALGLTPWGARLVRRVARGARSWWAVPVGALIVLLLGRLATLPFSVALQSRRRDVGLSTQDWGAWLVDIGLSFTVGWVAVALVLGVVVAFARTRPRRWFLGAGSAAALLVVAASYLYPVLVEPLFNDFQPLPEGPLRASVLRLADEQGVSVDQVLVADASRRTTGLNAYVSGFAGSRRVVLYDTLVREVPGDRARIIVSHELAHAKHRDVLLGTGLGAVAVIGAVALLGLALDSPRLRFRAGVEGAGDPAAVALVLALLAGASFLSSPVENTVSRAIEARADRESLETTGEGDTFVQLHRQLALANHHDPSPPAWSQLWFGSHPTVLQRAGLPSALGVTE